MDRSSETDRRELRLPEDTRKMVEITTEGPPTPETVTSETTRVQVVHEAFHSKASPSGEEKELVPFVVGESLREIRDTAENPESSTALAAEPIDSQQPERTDERALGTVMTAGLAGIVLQGSVGGKEKLVVYTRSARAHTDRTSLDRKPQPSCEGHGNSSSVEGEAGQPARPIEAPPRSKVVIATLHTWLHPSFFKEGVAQLPF
jgi:hypothetical protein